jgi:predicted nucleic acid-binding protein
VIFVDTSFWVGLTVRRDAHHDEAAALLDAYSSEPLVTSNLVRGESFTYLRRKAGHEIAVAFLDGIQRSPRLAIVPITTELEERALAWLRTHDEREYSFVDATSFADAVPEDQESARVRR